MQLKDTNVPLSKVRFLQMGSNG